MWDDADFDSGDPLVRYNAHQAAKGRTQPGPDACEQCGGSGQRATALSANGRELERHERSGTPCDACGGCGHDGWQAGCPKCEANEAAALEAMGEGPVLGHCPHGVDLDREFCPHGCRV